MMSFFMLLFALLALAVVVAIPVAIILAMRNRNPGMPHSVIAASAKVTDIRALGTGQSSQQLVTFELVDGRRLELLATLGLANQVRLGQHGTVHWAGDRVTGWVPELGGPQDSHRSE